MSDPKHLWVPGTAEMPVEAGVVVEDYMPRPEELVLAPGADEQTTMVVLDAHDAEMVLRRAQGAALRSWVYRLPDGKDGLSVSGVNDTIQLLNWTGKCRIGLLPPAEQGLVFEQVTADEGRGDEPWWLATAAARDAVTGQVMYGTAAEPQRMTLTAKTAAQWRKQGKQVPESGAVFNRFARAIAGNKAQRNALNMFIPAEIEQAIIAMAVGDPSRVQKIQTPAEAKLAEMPPPLVDDRAQALIARCEELYSEIRELGGGQGKVKFTPGAFQSWMLRSQHSHERLEGFVTYLEEKLRTMPGELEEEALTREAIDSSREVECPKCGAAKWKFCEGIRGAHGERIQARRDQLVAKKEAKGS